MTAGSPQLGSPEYFAQALADLLKVSEESIGIIRTFHGEPGWEIYLQRAPEMNRLITALSAARAALGAK
jgi:hypothetical protein